jgi:hypothetical protein
LKKTLLILFACGLLLVGGLGFWAQKHDYLLLWNSNSIVVTADTPLTTDKVKIEIIAIASISWHFPSEHPPVCALTLHG